MAKNKRTIYLGLDYTQFTGGIQEVNRKMGLLDAEFKLAQERAKNYGDETDTVGVKTDYLRQKIALQTEKVKIAAKAYDEACSAQNKSEKQIDALDKKLLQERTSLEKLRGQLADAEKSQEDLNKSTGSFGDTIRGLASTLGLSVNPAIEKLASKFDGVNAAAGSLVVVVAALGAKLVSLSKNVAQTADDLLTMSSVTGVSVENLQKLGYASSFVDVSVDTLAGSMKKLALSMNASKKGTGDAAEAFKALHVKTTDLHGQLLDSNEVFYKVIDSLGKMQNETQRDALAMQVFGESATELNPLIEAGSERLRELGVEADNLGVIMSESDVAAAGKLQDAIDRLGQTTDGLKNSLGMALVPMLTKLFEVISAIPVPVLQALTVFASVAATVLLVVKAIKAMTETGKAIGNFFSAINSSGLKTTAIIIGVVAALIALATIISVIAGKGSDVERAMASVGNSVGQMTGTVNNAKATVYSAQNHATGTANFAGGRTWVGEAGPELVTLPGGSSITPASKTGTSEYNTFYVTIDAKNVDDFNRVVQLCNQQKLALRRI